ncbi:MAG: DUF5626 family protein [Oscillospiraceae bacterium]|nr:DUF5626 family protein [Oscillospiraceae bacterium]
MIKKIISFIIAITTTISSYGLLNAEALDVKSTTIQQTEKAAIFDLTKNEKQEIIIKDTNGKDITIGIEPIYNTAKAHVTTGHTSWKIYINLVAINYSYMIDVFVSHTNRSSQITNVYSPKYLVVLGSVTQENLKIINKYEDSYNPASAEYNISYKSIGDFIAVKTGLRAEIKNQILKVKFW